MVLYRLKDQCLRSLHESTNSIRLQKAIHEGSWHASMHIFITPQLQMSHLLMLRTSGCKIDFTYGLVTSRAHRMLCSPRLQPASPDPSNVRRKV